MSADPPRKAYKYTCNMIRPQIYSEKSLMESVVDFFSDVVPQAYSGTQKCEDKEKIQWVRFENCDCNDVAKNPDMFRSDTKGLPLLLILGYSNGVQIWHITPNGDAQEILSLRQGPVRVCRILPNPEPVLGASDSYSSKRPLAIMCDSSSAGQPYCGVKFMSLKTGDEVHSISFKTLPVQNIECNKRFIALVFLEKICVHEACNFKQLFWVTSCFPCPGPSANPIAMSTRWLAYADKRLVAMHQSCGGMSGDGSQSYAATVISAAKGAFKGLSMFGEAMVSSVTGTKATPVKRDYVQLDNGNRPGIVTVVDIQNVHNDSFNVNEDNEGDGLIAHFHAHANEPVSHMTFDPTGTLLVTSCKLGHNFHVFRLMAHPVSSSLGAVHHLYTLHRGETTAKVIDISFNHDSRWVTVSSHRGTTHLFPITPYGGPVNVRTHCQPHVVNRASRFHRSAGLDEFEHVGRRSPILSTSPSSSGQYDRYPTLIQQNTLNNNMGNPRLPPYPHPITIYPAYQIKQPLNVVLNPNNKNQSPSHSPTGIDNVYSVCAKFCTPRLCVVGSPKLDMERRDAGKRPVDSLFVMAQSGTLVEYVLEPRAKSVSDKVTDDCLLELNIVGRMQWNLQRLKNSQELRPPLPSNSPLLLAHEAVVSQSPTAPDLYDMPGLTRQDSKDSLSSDHSNKDENDEQWVSHVEIITHAGPHRRLWMGPQFSFKTYQENTTVLSSNSSSLLSQSPESNMAAMDMAGDEGDLESLKLQPTRSNPVSMPNARPAYRRLSGSDSSPSPGQGVSTGGGPLLIEAGSFDQSPHLLDVYSNWTESTVAKQPRGSEDLEENILKETLADAMVESPIKDIEKLSLRQQDIARPSVRREPAKSESRRDAVSPRKVEKEPANENRKAIDGKNSSLEKRKGKEGKDAVKIGENTVKPKLSESDQTKVKDSNKNEDSDKNVKAKLSESDKLVEAKPNKENVCDSDKSVSDKTTLNSSNNLSDAKMNRKSDNKSRNGKINKRDSAEKEAVKPAVKTESQLTRGKSEKTDKGLKDTKAETAEKKVVKTDSSTDLKAKDGNGNKENTDKKFEDKDREKVVENMEESMLDTVAETVSSSSIGIDKVPGKDNNKSRPPVTQQPQTASTKTNGRKSGKKNSRKSLEREFNPEGCSKDLAESKDEKSEIDKSTSIEAKESTNVPSKDTIEATNIVIDDCNRAATAKEDIKSSPAKELETAKSGAKTVDPVKYIADDNISKSMFNKDVQPINETTATDSQKKSRSRMKEECDMHESIEVISPEKVQPVAEVENVDKTTANEILKSDSMESELKENSISTKPKFENVKPKKSKKGKKDNRTTEFDDSDQLFDQQVEENNMKELVIENKDLEVVKHTTTNINIERNVTAPDVITEEKVVCEKQNEDIALSRNEIAETKLENSKPRKERVRSNKTKIVTEEVTKIKNESENIGVKRVKIIDESCKIDKNIEATEDAITQAVETENPVKDTKLMSENDKENFDQDFAPVKSKKKKGANKQREIPIAKQIKANDELVKVEQKEEEENKERLTSAKTESEQSNVGNSTVLEDHTSVKDDLSNLSETEVENKVEDLPIMAGNEHDSPICGSGILDERKAVDKLNANDVIKTAIDPVEEMFERKSKRKKKKKKNVMDESVYFEETTYDAVSKTDEYQQSKISEPENLSIDREVDVENSVIETTEDLSREKIDMFEQPDNEREIPLAYNEISETDMISKAKDTKYEHKQDIETEELNKSDVAKSDVKIPKANDANQTTDENKAIKVDDTVRGWDNDDDTSFTVQKKKNRKKKKNVEERSETLKVETRKDESNLKSNVTKTEMVLEENDSIINTCKAQNISKAVTATETENENIENKNESKSDDSPVIKTVSVESVVESDKAEMSDSLEKDEHFEEARDGKSFDSEGDSRYETADDDPFAWEKSGVSKSNSESSDLFRVDKNKTGRNEVVGADSLENIDDVNDVEEEMSVLTLVSKSQIDGQDRDSNRESSEEKEVTAGLNKASAVSLYAETSSGSNRSSEEKETTGTEKNEAKKQDTKAKRKKKKNKR